MVTKVAKFKVKEENLNYVLKMNMENKFWSCITLKDDVYNISAYFVKKDD